MNPRSGTGLNHVEVGLIPAAHVCGRWLRCPVDSPAAGPKQPQTSSAADGDQKQICRVKNPNMGQHVVATIVQHTEEPSGLQGLAQGFTAVMSRLGSGPTHL